ncbi:MAG: PriCT-2 domain-containing protein [Proteobacteria bacterium]|nr:PriCT-2 domain-containing protein [Pseudomonadota bacterium]
MSRPTSEAPLIPNNNSSHSPQQNSYTSDRLQLLEKGYGPLPADGKAVRLRKWNSITIDRTEIESWANTSLGINTSLRCHNLAGVDIDVDDKQLVNSIVAMTRTELGNSPFERVGQVPRSLLVYQAAQSDIRKHVVKFRHNNKAQKVEILAYGQQFVAFGIHPDTQKEYDWVGPKNPMNTSIEDLPIVTRQGIDNYLLALEVFLENYGCNIIKKNVSTKKRRITNGGRIHADFLRAALDHISADDYDEWRTVGMSLHHESDGSSAGFEMWDEWSRTSSKYDESRENECESKWHGFCHTSHGVTGATVLGLAKEAGFKLNEYSGPREDYSADIVNLESDNLIHGNDRACARHSSDESFPEELLKPPGLVGLVAEYSNNAAFRDQPLLDICAGLITVASLTRNWFVVGPWRTPLNLYVVAVAETGEGKEAPRKAIKAALSVVDGLVRVKESVSSSTALLRALSSSDRHDITLLIDEFGRFLNVAANPNNSHAYDLVSELMRLFGQADTTYAGKIYANPQDNIPSINRPFVCMFGTTTRRSLTDALSSKDVVDGTLNRLLIVQTHNRRPAYKNPNINIGNDLKCALKNLQRLDPFELPDETGDDPADPMIICVSPEAEAALKKYRNEAEECRVANDNLGPLYARALENAVKVSGILAIGCAAEMGPIQNTKPVVDIEIANWAISFVRSCVSGIVKIGTEEIADSNIDRAITQIRNYIIAMTTEWEKTKAARDNDKREMNIKGYVARSQITKRFQKMPARLRDEAIQTLIQSEDIKCATVPGDKTEWFKPLRYE